MNLARLPLAASHLLVAAVLTYLFVTLDKGSFWLDELMSLYYSDPAHAAAGELWSRMTTDLHPPGYYVVLFGWRTLFGSSESAVRLLSMIAMTAVAAIYAWHVARCFGARIAALTLPVVAVSQVFVVYAQEARGYALLMLLTLVSTIVYTRACRGDTPLARTLPTLVLLCFLTETIHPYGVLWAGAICAGLLLFRPSLRERAAITAAGALLLVYPLARLAWMSSLAEGTFNWFAYLNTFEELLLGLSRPLLVAQDAWVAVVMLALVAWWVATRQIEWRRLAPTAPLWALLVVFVSSALAVHYLLEPSFNDRNLVIAAPVIWLLLAHAFGSVRESRVNAALLGAVVGLLVFNHALRSTWIARGFKSEWRDSAAFVDRYRAACATTPIPAFAYVDPERDEYFYELYLKHDYRFRFIDRAQLPTLLSSIPSEGSCPIKFWSPHGLLHDELDISADLAARRWRTVTFGHADPWTGRVLEEAFVIVADEP